MSLLPSSPYFPSNVSMFSNVGVSSGSNPYRSKTFRTTPITYSRLRTSFGRKSRVPLGGLVDCLSLTNSPTHQFSCDLPDLPDPPNLFAHVSHPVPDISICVELD